MKTLARTYLAATLIGALLLPAPASAQLYFLIGDNRPAAGAGATPPTQTGMRGFVHWNLREFPSCRVPYATHQLGTPDIVGAADKTAITNAFTTWENVAPAVIAFDERPNTTKKICTAGARMDKACTTDDTDVTTGCPGNAQCTGAGVPFTCCTGAGTGTCMNAVCPGCCGSSIGNDGENAILWDGGFGRNLTALGAPNSGTIALTINFYNSNTLVILEADTLFNDVDFQWNVTGDDLVSVRTTNAPPWNVNNTQTIFISVNGGANQTITLAGVTNGAATPSEIIANINAQLPTVTAKPVCASRVNCPSGPNPAIGVQVVSKTHDGTGTINVVGGTATAALGFPAGAVVTDAVDVETIAVHEFGHFVGIDHTSQIDPEPNLVLRNAVMFWLAPQTGTKRVLQPNDVQALNFLYTPDLGDAPDTGVGPAFNRYQTRVHGNANGRMLNGVQLTSTGLGPDHLFGFRGPVVPAAPPVPAQDYSHDRFEWLGADMDDSPLECDARLPDLDAFDDGMTMPKHLVPGGKNRVLVRVSTDNPGGARYNNANPDNRLYFNGYFDFNLNSLFDPAERVIFWSGVPGTTSASSANFVPAASNLAANPMVLAFDLQPPNVLPTPTTQFYARARLDLGEDEARAAGVPANSWEGDLAPAVRVAQFGEVEDHVVPPLFDHFQCYEIHRGPLNLLDVTLDDQFGPSFATIKRAKRLCAPADKNGEDPTAPGHPEHYTSYTIKQTSPKFQRIRGVKVANQFGELVVDVVKPDRLLVPTSKDLVSTPSPLPNPSDHFKCYKVSKAKFRLSGITTETQFGPTTIDIKRPLHLCVPVSKLGSGIVDPDTHLMCYKIVGARPLVPPQVYTFNQFGPDDFPIFGTRELCVPSSKRLP